MNAVGTVETRQLVYKGVLGRAWDVLLMNWGVNRSVAGRVRNMLFRELTNMVPKL